MSWQRAAKPQYVSKAHRLNSNARKMGVHGKITPRQLEALLEKGELVCAYCGADIQNAYELDHILPMSRGGENTIGNIAAACPKCNRSKSDSTVDEWIQEMRARLEWLGQHATKSKYEVLQEMYDDLRESHYALMRENARLEVHFDRRPRPDGTTLEFVYRLKG